MDIIDLKNYGPENIRGYRNVFKTIQNFSKYCWTLPLKSKNAQTIPNSFEKILVTSITKANSIETDEKKECLDKIFPDLLNANTVKRYSRFASQRAVFAEILNRTMRDLLKRPVSQKKYGNCIDILPTTTKQNNNKIQSSTKSKTLEAFLKKIEGFGDQNLIRETREVKTKGQNKGFR